MRLLFNRLITSRRASRLSILAAFLIQAAGLSAEEAGRLSVLTAMQPTYSLASALVHSTHIDVTNVPEDGRSLQALGTWIDRRGDRLAEIFGAADAVITIGRTWPEDPLYTAARAFNIRIVNIDASRPWSTTMSGVSVIQRPGNNVPWEISDGSSQQPMSATHFWLSYSNAIRMADIIARDLARLSPQDASMIGENLAALKAELLAVRRDLDDRLLELEDTTVLALADEFIYLTNEFGIFVDGYFIRQDIQWTADNYAALSTHLRENDVRVVVHKWEPSEEINAAVVDGGARLVVLQTGDPGLERDGKLADNGYQLILRQNVEVLIDALKSRG